MSLMELEQSIIPFRHSRFLMGGGLVAQYLFLGIFFWLFLFYNIVSVLFEIETFIMRDVICDHDSGVIYRQFKVTNIFDIVF